ncbi:myozenin-3 isoform X1 [Mastomys coucha]|uniref:myozenin-3 isoform X1 n=1 Tax=Mastomys coucha TaxID=35658 RepID=UPI0012613B79|nr:myozenin-3 isoform X1 [Mastomys coucha]XP_031221626.1 myozenin-3 isoform X1 [Mastomys coucha]
MIPKEQKEPVMAVPGDLAEPVPSLDLGKKLSVPQDLMIEELSLRNNRGSLLFQKRQRRVQKFTFELSESLQGILAGSARGKGAGGASQAQATVPNGLQEQNHHSETHVFQGSSGDSGMAHLGVAGTGSVRSPSALAPGYAEPLKGVPPEKFNHTAIPKGYRCPWQEFISYRDYPSGSRSHTPIPRDYRNFNKTPVPFGGPHVGEAIFHTGTSFVPEPFSGLELLRLRPNFNRVAQGWIRKLPESEEL